MSWLPCKDLDLAQTLDCGQAFRWQPAGQGSPAWEGAAFGQALCLVPEEGGLRLNCSQDQAQKLWRRYFDLDEDYGRIRQELAEFSPVLAQAAAYAPGIRILRQDPWEALCTFILSQNNHILRIKSLVSRFCTLFGDPVPGSAWRAFPPPAREPAEYGREELRRLPGVGPKVAECALLYGFHKTECFPMDVWMKRAMARLLPGVRPEDFGPRAGIAQQYLFHYSRMHPELFR